MKQDFKIERSTSLKKGRTQSDFRYIGSGVPIAAGSPEDRVYRLLFDSILEHRLTPGMKLKEVPLAQAFGVTRGVIRKVLSRLAALKLVDLRANHGATVSSPSMKELSEIFSVRRLIELAVIESVAGAVSVDQIAELRHLVASEGDSYMRGDTRSGIWLSMSFHIKLGEYANNTVLSEFLEQLVVRTPLILLTEGQKKSAKSCSAHDHTSIIDAIEAGDSRLAVSRMAQHLDHVERDAQPRRFDEKSELAALLGLS